MLYLKKWNSRLICATAQLHVNGSIFIADKTDKLPIYIAMQMSTHEMLVECAIMEYETYLRTSPFAPKINIKTIPLK